MSLTNQVDNQRHKYHPLTIQDKTLKMTTAQVVESSDTVTNSFFFPNYTHPDDHNRQTISGYSRVQTIYYVMLEGPKPCTIFCFTLTRLVEEFNWNVSIGQLLQHIFPNTLWLVKCQGQKR